MIQLHLLDVVYQSCSCGIDSWKILFLIHALNPRPQVLVVLVVASAAASAAVAVATVETVAAVAIVETFATVAVI